MSSVDESMKTYWTSVKFYRKTGKEVWLNNLRALALRLDRRSGKEALKFIYQLQQQEGRSGSR